MAYGVERFFLLSYCLACCWSGISSNDRLRVVRQWPELEFVYPSPEAERIAAEKQFYVRGNSVPIDVEMDYQTAPKKSRIFITIPRFDVGRPVTFGVVTDSGKIAGYPNYEWNDNQGSNCDGFTSVFRVAVDKCRRLWVLDAGKIGDKESCPPQIVAFDLNTDQVIYRHKIPSSQYIATSLFVTIVVDVRGDNPNDCSDTYIYAADVTGFGLLVLDVQKDTSWRITQKYLYPYPSAGTFTIEGESFDLMDGVLGMALSPYRKNHERFLYFHALASVTENVVRSTVLRNSSFITNSNADPEAFNAFPEQRPNQSAAEAMDSNGILYFGLMEPPGIWCWNSATEYSPRNFHQIALNRETLQFASGVKIVRNLKNEEELWVLTCRFQKVMTGTLDSNEINFRIHAEKLSNLLKNSACLNPEKHRGQDYHADRISPVITNRIYKYGSVSFL